MSAHTLRRGLLSPTARNASGHRNFGEAELTWIAFVKSLKATVMPRADIRRYAELRAEGETTIDARRRLLAAHADSLARRIAREQDHLEGICAKIAYYRSLDAVNTSGT